MSHSLSNSLSHSHLHTHSWIISICPNTKTNEPRLDIQAFLNHIDVNIQKLIANSSGRCVYAFCLPLHRRCFCYEWMKEMLIHSRMLNRFCDELWIRLKRQNKRQYGVHATPYTVRAHSGHKQNMKRRICKSQRM